MGGEWHAEHGSLAELRRLSSELGEAKETGIYRAEYWKEER